MANYTMGEYIRRRRLELGIHQRVLCDGICDRGTLSRIELGKQQPNKHVFDALMQRLGVVPGHYTSFLTAGEFKLEELKRELGNAAFYQNFDKMEHLINAIEASPEYGIIAVQRLVTHFKTIVSTTENNLEENLSLLKSVMLATRPRYDENKITELLLSVDEVKMINNMANIYSDLMDHEKACNIYVQLIENLEAAYFDSEEKDILLIMLYYNYSRTLGLDKKYEQSVEIAQKGIDISLKLGRAIQLAYLYINVAYCFNYLNRISEVIPYFKEAITLFRILKMSDAADYAIKEFKDAFNITYNRN